MHLNSKLVFITLMSKLSNVGLLFLIIGTLLIVFSIFLSIIILPGFFLSIQISGWVFIGLGTIFLLLTKGEYHIIKFKSGFVLKLDHLIILVCAMLISISFLIFVDISSYIYTGNFTYFTIVWVVYLSGGTIILYFLKTKK